MMLADSANIYSGHYLEVDTKIRWSTFTGLDCDVTVAGRDSMYVEENVFGGEREI